MRRVASKRLILRPFDANDIPVFAKMSADERVMKYVASGTQDFAEVSETISYFLSHLKRYGYGVMAIHDKASKDLVGYCGFNHHNIDGKEYVELGYRIIPEFWGKGYATEAAGKMLDYAFNDLKLPELISIIHPEHMASIKVATKIGMKTLKRTKYQGLIVDIYYIKNPNTAS